MAVSAPPPDLQRLSLGRESFAVSCPLALLGAACYPVRVPRPADALAASFGAPLTVGAWRSAWVVTTNSPEDFHLQSIVHAGRNRDRRQRRRTATPLPPPRTYASLSGAVERFCSA